MTQSGYFKFVFIIEVIPLTSLPVHAPQLLSYFFSKNLLRGAVVEISIGNRKVVAAVVSSYPLESHKIALKKSEFQLKKITGIVSETPQISDSQLKIALWLAKYYYAPLGQSLKMVLPALFLKKRYETKIQNSKFKIQNSIHRPLFLLTNAKETLANILPFIKKSIENNGQSALIVPDSSTLDYFYDALAARYPTVKISSDTANKKLFEAWKKVSSGQPLIVIGTRQALFLPFKNLKLIIVDDILHEAYKSDMSPKYNTPELAKQIAELNGARIILISTISGADNYFHLKNKEYELLDKTGPRPKIKIINMVGEIKSGNFSIFSRELKNQILASVNPNHQNKKILIFSPRRGYSSVLVCQNCGLAVKCPNCNLAFRVHKTTDLILMCHHCSAIQKMPESCLNCQSYKLKTVGPAGTQKIYDEVQRFLAFNEAGKVPILILDSDVIKNDAEEQEILDEMKNPRTSVIIATQMIFSHRYSYNFNLIGILNADSLINNPDYKTEERLFYQIEKLIDFLPAQSGQPENLIIQTYNPENPAIITAGLGNYKEFYEKELAVRKAFSYPPFARLVKLTFRHKDREKASYAARVLSSQLKMAIGQLKIDRDVKLIDAFPAFTEKERELYSYNIVLKILPGLENLRDILKFIPSNWLIDVDPRSIL